MARRRRHRAWNGGVLILMIAWAMMVGAPMASAHAVLQSSTPDIGAVLPADAVVDRVTLVFDEPVDMLAGAVQVIASDGHRVDAGNVQHLGNDGARVSVGVRTGLAGGSYLVVWQVVSADSHPVHGSFSFSIGRPGAIADVPSTTPDGGISTALFTVRMAELLSLLVLGGALSFYLVCLPSAWPRVRRSGAITGVVTLAAAADIVGFVLQAATDAGGRWADTMDLDVLTGVLATQSGTAHLIRLAILCLIWISLRATAKHGAVRWVFAALFTLLFASVAVEGHQSTSPVSVAVDVVHLAAAAVWLGGLCALSVVLLAGRNRGRLVRTDLRQQDAVAANVAVLQAEIGVAEPQILAAVRTFSTMAMFSVVCLVASGVVQSLQQVTEVDELTGTAYGRLLLVKVTLVGLALAGAAVSRATTRGWARRAGSRTRLGRSVALETLLLLIVVGVTTALTTTPPARISYRPVVDTSVQAGPVSVHLTAVPLTALTDSIHLYVYGADGLPAEVLGATAEATPPGASLSPVTIPLLPAGSGHFVAGRVLLPQVGSWTITLVIRTSEFDAYTATTALTVR